MSTTADRPAGHEPAGNADTGYMAIQDTPEFADLRARFRKFVFPMTGLFLAWYFLYVLLSTYAPDLMATPVLGNVNLGILLGLGQFVSTFVITHVYVAHANKRTDPISDEMRERLEHHEYARPGGVGVTRGVDETRGGRQ